MSTFPTDAEREVINRVLPDYLATRQVLMAALVPLVADRERAAAARALREAAASLSPGSYVGPGWLEDRADELEAGEGRG